MEAPKPIEGTWTLVTPNGNRYHGDSPLKCCRSEQEDRLPKEIREKRQLELFADLVTDEEGQRRDLWRKPTGECPEGNLLVEIDLKNGDSDIALVFIDEDGETLRHADEFEDVYTAWSWLNVSRYATLEDILPSR